MADKSSRDGGGGLGWLIIGLLIGVAGTLATQKFVVFKGEAAPDATTAALQPPATGALPGDRPKLIVHQGGLLAQGASPGAEGPVVSPDPVVTDESPADVADDAAATGMTARARPQKPPAN